MNHRLWGAERLRGEWLNLGLGVCTRTIQKYMRPGRAAGPRGQKWSTFLHPPAEQIWVCDASPSHGSPLPLAVRLLHQRIAILQSDPRRRHKKSCGWFGPIDEALLERLKAKACHSLDASK